MTIFFKIKMNEIKSCLERGKPGESLQAADKLINQIIQK